MLGSKAVSEERSSGLVYFSKDGFGEFLEKLGESVLASGGEDEEVEAAFLGTENVNDPCFSAMFSDCNRLRRSRRF